MYIYGSITKSIQKYKVLGWNIEIGELCSNFKKQKHNGAMNVILKQWDIDLHIYHTGIVHRSIKLSSLSISFNI